MVCVQRLVCKGVCSICTPKLIVKVPGVTILRSVHSHAKEFDVITHILYVVRCFLFAL